MMQIKISGKIISTTIVLIMFLNLLNLNLPISMISSVEADTAWNQTSDIDFNNGVLINLTINNSGNDAELQLTREVLGHWTEKYPSTKPTQREFHSMASFYDNDKVLLFGGERHSVLNDTWIYDLSDNQWVKKTPLNMPSQRRSCGMATVSGTDNVVLFGGQIFGGSSNETWAYDLSIDNWINKNPLTFPQNRSFHSMSSIFGTDQIFLFGGSYPFGPDPYNDTWIYDFSDNTWTRKYPSTWPDGRIYFSSANIYGTDKIIIYAKPGTFKISFNDPNKWN
jgi:hypothetical protein